MNIRSTVVALLFLLSLCTFAAAEDIPEDDLFRAVDRAGKELAEGKGRQEVMDRLNQAIAQNAKSIYLTLAQRLTADLSESIKKEAIDPQSKKSLMETTLHIHLIGTSVNWKSLDKFIETHPDDPFSSILRQDRQVIDSLLPLLRDPSPTRSYWGLHISGEVPKVPRVCDVVLLTIEHFSKCRFHFNAFTKKLFHELSPEDREKTIGQIENWWQDNKEKSVADGIRAQLPQAEFYEKLEMANNLARLEDQTNENSDKAYAMEVLHTLTRENWGPKAARAADVLARLGDVSAVDEFYIRWKESIDDPQIYSSHIAFYLLDHGSRREWEFLYTIAEQEIGPGREAGYNGVWPLLVNCRKARTSLLAIPGLALALTQTKEAGARFVEGVGSQGFSYADTAAEYLQKLTGTDFGYRRNDSSENRSAAIEKAQNWWIAEGRRKFTFDYIETVLKNGNNQSENHDKQ